MERRLRAALLVLALAPAACARPLPAVAPAPVRFDFAWLADSILNSPPLDRAHIGIAVFDPAAQRMLYAHNAQRRFVPASNQKFWVTATALHELGAEYRYRTPVIAVGFDEAAGAARTLVVVGRGDPTLSARFHAGDHTALEMLADSVRAVGVRHVRELVVDASAFDEAIIPGTWTFGNLNGTSAPPTGAFVTAEGLFRLTIAPGAQPGDPAAITPHAPAGLVPVLNRTSTAVAGAAGSVGVNRGPWDDTLRVRGGIAVDAEAQARRLPMTDPVRFAAHVFADALRARSVAVDAVRIVTDTAEARALRDGLPDASALLSVGEVAAWESPPMSDIVAAILGPSQNWIAEQLVRTLGAERRGTGSWGAGNAVQNTFLFRTVGIDSAALRLQDGSGMSHQNLVTPEAVVQLLDHARTASWGPVFRAALAKPGQPGTLSGRLRSLDGRLEGKTGTLSNVNALSGYVRTRDGRELIFSIISNASGLPGGPVVTAIDRLVEALADGAVPR